MHTAMTILGGLLLLAVFAIFGWLWGGTQGVPVALRLFLPAWLALTLANLWVGVSRAGYGLAQELPILAVNIIVPAVVALAAAWQLTRG